MTIEEALGVLDAVLQPTRLNDTQEAVFRQAWAGQTYEEIATELNFAVEYIRAVGAQLWQTLSKALDERVTKQNLRTALERWERQHTIVPSAPPLTQQDWGEAIDVSTFWGRTDELATLSQWVVNDRCRLLALLGMGGLGKTSLSVKLAQQVQSEFDVLIWRSLRNAPLLPELLVSLLQFLSEDGALPIPDTVDQQLSQLIQYLRDRRCLIILDNAEMILGRGDAASLTSHYHAGDYREGYEAYGDLFQLVGTVPHQSC